VGRLDGKIALVLGASSPKGIGAASARIFMREGAKVTVASRRPAALAALTADIGAMPLECDVTVDDSVEKLVQEVMLVHGRLDIAVYSVGVSLRNEILSLDLAAVRRTVEVQFIGALRFLASTAAVMATGGSIVMISSLSARLAPWGWAAYAGTKAGIDQVVKVAATELGPRNIRVNAVAPGLVRTEMTESVFQDSPGTVKAMLKEQRIPRLATSEDIANAILWLASDEAFMTGQVLQLSGGGDLGKYPLPNERNPA
jgi:NAD(P)-dependent dehydrogenase (short-subunit alcohol dehydrogenase family)